jgi:hypothetical protein
MNSNFPIKSIHPILLPPKQFKDRFNNANAFVEMNPSMHIDANGTVVILVRSVNYRKYKDKQFTLYQNYSDSIYTILRGKITEKEPLNLETFRIQDLQYQYGIPTYSTYWKGLEDIRFITPYSLLTTIPECNENGNPSIFKATLQGSIIHSFSACKPNKIEKNWMPFLPANSDPKVIYSLHPFKIKSVEDETLEEIKLSDTIQQKIEGYHGSTNGIPYNGENTFLFLIHLNKDRSYHRWLLFNYETRVVQVSESFSFFSHTYIEFPCSLCSYKDRIFISCGINDDKAMILEVEKDNIDISLIVV